MPSFDPRSWPASPSSSRPVLLLAAALLLPAVLASAGGACAAGSARAPGVGGGFTGTGGGATGPSSSSGGPAGPASSSSGPAGSGGGSSSSSSGALPDGGDAGSFMPVAPADARDRIGIYAWGFDTTSWPGSPDRLSWAAAKVAALGSRTIRVYLGPQDIYKVLPAGSGTFDLATAAASPAYHALFASPSFDAILLTTYSATDDQSDWTTGYSAAQVAAERQQIATLGTYLLAAFPGKTFILSNWEGDNAIASVAGNQAAWDGFIAWTNARAAGVADARAASPGASAHLYSAVEFNLLRTASNQAPCDTTANKCVVSVVLPAVSVDYYSYSSWDSLLPNQTPAQTAAQLQADLTTALGWARKHDPSVTPARFIVGELGAPREQADLGECAATSRIAAVIGAVQSWGASYGVFWQIIDNVQQAGTLVTGFGLYKTSGAASLGAQLFQTLYQTQAPTVPSAPSCPLVNQGGVVNAAYPNMTAISSTTVLSIYGKGFTAAGNVVHVRESGGSWDVKAGSPVWYESAGQINLTLPGIGASQSALVYETDSDGIDANGQIISIGP